jgi:G3E family GTPase
MKTTIICGMLGAGKTSYIQDQLTRRDGRTVVLVNDFGQTGIDGEILSAGGMEVMELPSGCVCCTLKFDLITTIQKIRREWNPPHLMIEPSGIASPSGILEALDSLHLQPVTVVGIIDVTEFLEAFASEMYGTFFLDQVTTSDLLLVNKTDLADEERIAETREKLRHLNPRALILLTTRGVLKDPFPVPVREKTLPEHRGHSFPCETLSLQISPGFSYSLMETLFADLKRGRYGTVFRAKALVETDRGTFRIDLSSHGIDVSPYPHAIKTNRLVVLGRGLQEIRLPDAS